MTDEQLKELGKILAEQGGNVYQIAEKKFGCKFTDADADRLESVAGIFKCDECNSWLDSSEKEPGFSSCCSECVGGQIDEDDE